MVCEHYLEDIAVTDLVSGFVILKHLLQDLGLLLHLCDFFRRLCAIVCFMSRVIPSHDFHQSIRLLEILGSPSADQFLEFGGLRCAVFLLHFLRRLEIL